MAAPQAVRGLAVSDDDGLTLELARAPRERAPSASTLAFRIVDCDGRTVRDFDVEHTKRMHLIVVRRDMTGFQHLHPTQRRRRHVVGRRPRCPDAGALPRVRRLLDRRASRTRSADDLVVDGAVRSQAAARAGRRRRRRRLRREPQRRARGSAGAESQLRFTRHARRHAGRASQPYLGAKGHLVALREGDLAYLHVHPRRGHA